MKKRLRGIRVKVAAGIMGLVLVGQASAQSTAMVARGRSVDADPNNRSLTDPYQLGPAPLSDHSKPPYFTRRVGNRQHGFYFWCELPGGDDRPFTADDIPNSEMRLTHEAVPGTGGHVHANQNVGARPKGAFDDYAFNSGPTAVATVLYTTPEVAGVIEAVLSCLVCNAEGVCGPDPDPGTFTFGVEYKGLVRLPPSPTFRNSATSRYGPNHPDNHWADPLMADAVLAFARIWHERTDTPLPLNDISLEGGGKFDYKGDWSGSHAWHRYGIDADINICSNMLVWNQWARAISLRFDHPDPGCNSHYILSEPSASREQQAP